MSGRKRIAANVGALALARGGTMALTLFTYARLTRALGPESFGVLAWAGALGAYFMTAIDLGLNAYLVREVAKAPSRVSEFAGRLIGVRVALLTVGAVVYGAVVVLLDKPPAFKAVVAVWGISLVGFASTLDWAYQGTQRMGRLALRNVGVAALLLAGTVAFVHGPDDAVAAAGVSVATVLIASASVMGMFVREYGAIRPVLAPSEWPVLLRGALPLGASLLLMQVYSTADQLMLGVMRPEEEVGWYASGYRLLTAALIVDSVLQQAYLPALAEVRPESPEGTSRGRDYVSALAAVGLPVAFGAAVFADQILVLFAGPAYAPGGPALAVLFVYAGVTYTTKAWGDSLVAWNLERRFLGAVAAAAVVNVVLNAALIPQYGMMGAAAATLASGLVGGWRMAVAYRRLTGTLHLDVLGRIWLAVGVGVVVPALAVRHLGGPVWVGVLVALPAYVGCALALRVVPPTLRAAVGTRLAAWRAPAPP